jgi:hypothetical protein
LFWNVILETPVVFDPSNYHITSPNKARDFGMTVMNFLTSMAMEAAIRFIFLQASTQVDAGSQQSDNLGP